MPSGNKSAASFGSFIDRAEAETTLEVKSNNARKMLKKAKAEGKSQEELVALLKEHFYTEETKKIQPEKAFYLNAGYIIICMLKEN